MKNIFILILLFFSFSTISGQYEITSTNTLLNPTFEHISVHIDIVGDINRNSKCLIEYKEVNTQNFKKSAIVMRAHPEMVVDGKKINRNHFAGSILFLKPLTSYDIKVKITDPDNTSVINLNYISTTKEFPMPAINGTIKYVMPGNGGGQGTENAPYLGLQYAADYALPGDIFIVTPGVYDPFQLLNSGERDQPIVFLSQDQHKAVIDGNETNRGIITIGKYDTQISQVIIDGFIIKNGTWGLDAQHTKYLTVQNNIFKNVDYGFINRRDSNNENNQYIFNNIFEGKTSWPQLNGNIPSERAIDIRGNNNVVAFNTISNFGDGISCDGNQGESSFSLDIHNNEISNIVDDIIEIDGNISNTRVYNNRGLNGRMGVSLAPVFGGPAYIFRNIFYNLELSTFKMNRKPAGLVLVHNLGIKTGNGTSSDPGWQNTFIKNNIIMSIRYCFEEYGQINSEIEDWDYNAYYSTRTGTVDNPWFKWQNKRYSNIQDLKMNTSIEQNGISISLDDLQSVSMPQTYGLSFNPKQFDFRLSNNSSMINNGIVLKNINDLYVTDGMPDIGPYELGKDLPQYGAVFNKINKSLSVENNSYICYPNPTTGLISLNRTKNNYKLIKGFDINGSVVLVETINNDIQSLDLTSLNNGIYWLKFIDEKQEKTFVERIILLK